MCGVEVMWYTLGWWWRPPEGRELWEDEGVMPGVVRCDELSERWRRWSFSGCWMIWRKYQLKHNILLRKTDIKSVVDHIRSDERYSQNILHYDNGHFIGKELISGLISFETPHVVVCTAAVELMHLWSPIETSIEMPSKTFILTLTYDLQLWAWPRYPPIWPPCQNSSMYVFWFGWDSKMDTDKRCQNYYTPHWQKV